MDREEFWRRVGVVGTAIMGVEGISFYRWVTAGVWDDETGVRFLAWVVITAILFGVTVKMYYEEIERRNG